MPNSDMSIIHSLRELLCVKRFVLAEIVQVLFKD